MQEFGSVYKPELQPLALPVMQPSLLNLRTIVPGDYSDFYPENRLTELVILSENDLWTTSPVELQYSMSKAKGLTFKFPTPPPGHSLAYSGECEQC